MQYRCNDCGELFESHHTNYKHAKGYHPNDNPKQSAVVAKSNDHCTNCQAMRTYNPVEARKRDLAVASGFDNSLITSYQQKIDELTAKIEAQSATNSTLDAMKETISNLEKKLQAAA